DGRVLSIRMLPHASSASPSSATSRSVLSYGPAALLAGFDSPAAAALCSRGSGSGVADCASASTVYELVLAQQTGDYHRVHAPADFALQSRLTAPAATVPLGDRSVWVAARSAVI